MRVVYSRLRPSSPSGREAAAEFPALVGPRNKSPRNGFETLGKENIV
jgi:hypothetical protein